MKKLYLISLIFLSSTIYAQNHFNQWVISGGVSYSLLKGIHKLPFSEYKNDFKFTVGGQANADWGLIRRLSFGLGVSHHRHHLNIYDYEYTIDGQTFIEDPIQSIFSTCYNLRVLIHMRKVYENSDEKIDLYWGGLQQFIYVRNISTSNDPNFYRLQQNLDAIPGIIGGVRYYPTDHIGMYFEMAFPGPNTISAGLAYRIKNK
ncbi:MAG: hypothetical protein ACI8ZM_005389 [Crocinitomix sp.]|jgi:hypothetical protein